MNQFVITILTMISFYLPLLSADILNTLLLAFLFRLYCNDFAQRHNEKVILMYYVDNVTVQAYTVTQQEGLN